MGELNAQPNTPLPGHAAVDVQQIMKEVRNRLQSENHEHDELMRLARKSVPGHLPATIARLKASTQALAEAAKRIGDIPPAPPTLRARIGSLLVRAMQRALFWLIPSVKTAQQSLAQTLRDHVYATDELLKALQQTNMRLELLRREVASKAGS